ncbi:MAG: hypothetical protein ACI31M_02950 [Bacilli bacterium]
MSKKNTLTITIIGILLMIAVTIAVSYAFWSVTRTQESTNVITTGNLSVSISREENAINIENAYPISDEAGAALTPFTFTITNDGDTYTEYTANLEVLAASTLSTNFVALKLNTDDIKILSSLPEGTKSMDTSLESRTLATGGLDAGESVTYQLRLWIDKSATINDDVQNKNFETKIVVYGKAVTKPTA